MFTFGIFTTHIPYIAMVAFYAFFLLFGANKANEGKIKMAEKSHLVQVHIDNSVESFPSGTYCFYTTSYEHKEAYNIETNTVRQKWKYYSVSKLSPKDFLGNTLFGRPPPVLA